MASSHLSFIKISCIYILAVSSLQIEIEGNTTNYRKDDIMTIVSAEGDLGQWDGTKYCQFGQFAIEYASSINVFSVNHFFNYVTHIETKALKLDRKRWMVVRILDY